MSKYLRRASVLRARARTTQTASEGATTAERGAGSRTEIEGALRAAGTEVHEGAGAGYDFKEENAILKRDGWIFRSIQIPASYLPGHLVGQLTEEVAQLYEREARKFFAVPVPQSANRLSLYEDAEGAFIISLFRSVDRRCYYVLNEMRKTINGNACKLVLVFSGILYAWCLSSLFAFSMAGDTNDAVSNFLAALWMTVTAAVAGGTMVFLQNSLYKQHQRHNARELRTFLIQYIGRIADRYREATGNAKQVTVGDETDPKMLSQRAQKWHKIMMWTPFRTFYIECFVRSVRYQIDRNCGYYLMIPNVAWPLLIVVLLAFAVFPASVGPMVVLAIFALLLAILTWVYFERIRSVVIGEELSRLDYLGYDNLNVSTAMDEVVGKYAEDVGFWKGRMKF